jgi:uncharacterized protein YcgL (UPF0745 family)
MKAFRAIYRSPKKDMDFLFVEKDIKAAAESARVMFTGLGLLGLPRSELRVRLIPDGAQGAFATAK